MTAILQPVLHTIMARLPEFAVYKLLILAVIIG